MIPGPSQPDPRVRAALSLPVLPHYGQAWSDIYKDVTSKLQRVFATKNDVLIVPIPGQVAVEMSVVNLVGQGGEGVVCANGTFSGMIAEMIESIGGRATTITAEPGKGFTAEVVSRALEGRRDLAGKPLFLVHTETSTGAASDPSQIFKVCREKGMITVLDCISTFGGMDVRVDDWGADYTIGYASKALGGVFGAQPVAIGKSAWEAARANAPRIKSHFLNLNIWKKSIEEDSSWGHPYPSSMPTSVITALREAVDLALEEGLEARYRRHADAANQIRSGFSQMGLELLTERRFYSSTVTVAKTDPRWEGKLRKQLLEEYGIMVAGGLGPLAGHVIRIGHMGTSATHESASTLLAAVSNIIRLVKA